LIKNIATMDEDPKAPRVASTKQVDNALRAINEKKPVPEIDFTLHTMEDNSTVSTMERVCKGI
jgi:serine/threonine-protein phosphatase 2B catalytic subunit